MKRTRKTSCLFLLKNVQVKAWQTVCGAITCLSEAVWAICSQPQRRCSSIGIVHRTQFTDRCIEKMDRQGQRGIPLASKRLKSRYLRRRCQMSMVGFHDIPQSRSCETVLNLTTREGRPQQVPRPRRSADEIDAGALTKTRRLEASLGEDDGEELAALQDCSGRAQQQAQVPPVEKRIADCEETCGVSGRDMKKKAAEVKRKRVLKE